MESTDIKQIVKDIIKEKADKGGVKSLYYVGCGGSYGALYPAKTFMQQESSIVSNLISSNEFVHNTPEAFGENSILVVSCHKGNTPETIQAAKLGQEKGATVIVLTWFKESEIIQYGDYIIRYTFDENHSYHKDIAGEKAICALLVAVELVNDLEGYANYDKFMDGLSRINRIVQHACKHVEKRALAYADTHKDVENVYMMGSGSAYGAAYMEDICFFMEMQWVNSSTIHSGEFFHGPFEITDVETPFIIQINEGHTRALDERAAHFLKKYAKDVEVLDAKDLGISSIDTDVVDYFCFSLFNNVYSVYNLAIADARQHPLTTRRYMWKVEY